LKNPGIPDETPSRSSFGTVGLPEIYRLLKRRKWLVLLIVVIFVAGSAIYTLRLPKRYEALCKIDIDLSTPKSVLALDSQSSASAATEQKMATQLSILGSQAIAWKVIEELKLDANPAFTGNTSGAARKPLNSLTDQERYSLIRLFQSGLGVQLERGTEIVQIRYRSTSPSLAATIANTVAAKYIQRNFETKYNTTHETSAWLQDQLETLRHQVDADQRNFEDFQKRTGLLQTDEGHNAIVDRLAQLNTALSTAQTQRIIKEVTFRESMVSDPDQISPSSNFPGLSALRAQKVTLESQYASLSPKYGDSYPRVAQTKSELAEVNRSIASELRRGRNQLELDYKLALENENKLRVATEAQKQQIFSMNEDALHYSILQSQVASGRALYQDLTRKLQEAQITSGLSSDTISIIDPALTPNIPSEPRRALNIEAGSLLGLVVALAVVFLIENANATIRTGEDIYRYSGLPVLSIVPHLSPNQRSGKLIGRKEGTGASEALGLEPRVLQYPQSHFAESFRVLRSALLLSLAGDPPQLIVICSAWTKEGKSTITINLATVLGQMNRRVLLVDADLRRPSLHHKLGLPKTDKGLSNLLAVSQSPPLVEYLHPTSIFPGLDFLPAGPLPPSSSELLMSPRMSELFEEWRKVYDFIVVDTAPLLAVSDTTALVATSDTTVVVVRDDATRKQSLQAVRDTIVSVRGRVAGVVLNDVKTSSEAYYAYYGNQDGGASYYAEADNA
jgi:polysaccharide biosynthesis transport protein